jgi:hypothetical protein
MRDHAQLLEGERCWDAGVEAIYRQSGEPRVDAILQNRAELTALCQQMELEGVQSYLEIGLWSGRLLCCLHRIFRFRLVAGCDDGYAQRLGLPLHLPPEAQRFLGSSRSPDYLAWRRQLGPIDLVFIDGDHRYAGVKADLEREAALPHRILALHDITGANRHTIGVARLWSELRGEKLELCMPNPELEEPRSTMGIGLWRSEGRFVRREAGWTVR